MPRYDDCHSQVVRALEKDGWRVSDKAIRIRTPRRTIHIDARASRRSNGRQQQILLAEVKCFPDANSTTTDLYIAIGQYILYRAVLAIIQDATPLYLVIPAWAYQDIFDTAARHAINDSKIKLIVVDVETESVREWIE